VSVVADPDADNLLTVSAAGVMVDEDDILTLVSGMVTPVASVPTAASTTTMASSGVTDPTTGFAGGATGALAFSTETLTLRAGCGQEVQLDATGAIYSIRPAVFSFASTGYSSGGCVSTNGAPIFCDSAGRLRGVPDHRSAASRTTVADSDVVAFSTGSDTPSTVSVTVNNPSTCRIFAVLGIQETMFEFEIDALQEIYHKIDIVAGFFTGSVTKFAHIGWAGIDSHEIETSSTAQAGTIAAGGSQAFTHSLEWDTDGSVVGGNHLASSATFSYVGSTT
jgi:hypothetical protein